MSEDQIGKILTFYSYKAGTGRSMALANVACLLAQSGKQVLMVDWDLDAPGLQKFFSGKLQLYENFAGDLTGDWHPGLIDFFIELNERIQDLDRPEKAIVAQRTESHYAMQTEEEAKALFSIISLNNFILKTDIPNLDLLKAGSFDPNYPSRVRQFKWEALFNRSPFLMRSFAEELTRNYDYTLIDSRSGITDIGGICTMLMPDKLIGVFTLNHQNLLGTSTVVESALRYRRESPDLRPLIVFPLPSRVEGSEVHLKHQWRYGSRNHNIMGYQPLFEELFRRIYSLDECDLNDYFNEVQIPHVPRYAFGESIVVLERLSDRLSLASCYKDFADWLTNREIPW